ncbi:MmoB/DmpM family protein [Mycobacterium paragordonae]|uniref:MmoB/DmpM family protein n=1 Tax=Mycobacterium paragordonae TaxID=1389713 RepID=UPI0022AF5C3D|nr:MmoB/DmpM family protein [Mycobacterium paragordonae]
MDEETAANHDLVGPVIRSGNLAEAVIDAVEEDNPDCDVLVLDRDDYVRIHTLGTCRLTRASLEKALGEPFPLASLEIDMPAFRGRMKTRTDEYIWFYDHAEQEQ